MPKRQLNMAEVAFWLAEADSCENRQRIELMAMNNYPLLINYFEGFQTQDVTHPHVATKRRMSIINEFFPNTNARISELMYKNPDMLLEALKPQAEENTPLMKSALEYFFDKGDGLVENRVALFDMLYAGYCGVEVDVINEKRDKVEEEEPQPATPERESIFDKVANKLKRAKNEEDAENNFALASPSLETPFATVQGTYIRRYDPLDIPLDWRAERVKDRRYNLKKVWMSKAEFDAKYPKFKNRVMAEDKAFAFSRHKLKQNNSKVKLFEFQARLKGNEYITIVLSNHVKTEAIDMFPRPYTTNGFNMKIGTLHKYGKLYAVSVAQINKTMQDEMNSYVRHMMEVAERNVPKRIADENKVKGDAVSALNNKRVNDIAFVNGNPLSAVVAAPHTNISIENKELLGIFQDQKTKLWSVSEPKISGQSKATFATEIAIQEAGFQANQIDTQEGLRILINAELDTGKDIIATFWDNEVFLKVTGHPKMDWYEPIMVTDQRTGRQIVANPLTDILTGDYNVKIDIASAALKNRDAELQNMIFYMKQLVQLLPVIKEQQRTINVDEIIRIGKEFGWNPDKLLIPFEINQQPTIQTQTGENLTPEEDAQRQAEAEARLNGQGAVA